MPNDSQSVIPFFVFEEDKDQQEVQSIQSEKELQILKEDIQIVHHIEKESENKDNHTETSKESEQQPTRNRQIVDRKTQPETHSSNNCNILISKPSIIISESSNFSNRPNINQIFSQTIINIDEYFENEKNLMIIDECQKYCIQNDIILNMKQLEGKKNFFLQMKESIMKKGKLKFESFILTPELLFGISNTARSQGNLNIEFTRILDILNTMIQNFNNKKDDFNSSGIIDKA